MTPELWERLNPLFQEAVERPQQDRAAFVAAVCGTDQELRRELVALLDAHEHQTTLAGRFGSELDRLVDSADPRHLAPGALIFDRFEVVSHLGSGGMGDVYKAFDRELDQMVALKMIRHEIVRNEQILSRFKREVQLARRLSGPNLCRIYELFVLKEKTGLIAGAFLTMELLDGISLADKVNQGALSLRDVNAIAVDICSGLSVMHNAGIIHRDLKTRNIMLADRNGAQRAVLMDFGLAFDVSEPTVSALTGLTLPGAVLGTPEYMAPEQFEGKRVTSAADIYAVGIVLYELVTHKNPFASSSPMGAAVLRGKKPPPPSSVVPGLPRRFDFVIAKCLEYEPALRFQSAEQVARALSAHAFILPRIDKSSAPTLLLTSAVALLLSCTWLVPSAREWMQGLFSNSEKHIVVLPFAVAGSDQGVSLQAEGLMDSLTGKLSALDPDNKTLWVVPASEVRRSKVNDPRSAFREFGATMVVTGHFSHESNGLRLYLDLIDAKNMREIGYADIVNPERDWSALQTDVIASLGRLMHISTRDRAAHAGDEGVSSAAYQNYIEALGYLERFDRPGYLDNAIQSLHRSVESNPRFILALSKLGEVYTLKYGVDANPDYLEKARLWCTRAISLDNRVPAAYAAMANLDRISGRTDLAAEQYRHVIDLDPRNVEALTGMAKLYASEGRYEDAEKQLIRAEQLRPGDWIRYNELGNFYDNIGRHNEAIAQFQSALKLTPDNAIIFCNLGNAFVNSGQAALLSDAENAFLKSISILPTYQAYAGLGNLYGVEEKYKESAAVTEKALQIDNQDFQAWNNLSQAYEALHDIDKAAGARKQAIELAERTLRVNDQNAEAHAELAELLARENRTDPAHSHILTALALASDDQSVLSDVADAYEILGDRKRAIMYLEMALQKGLPQLQLNADVALKRVSADPQFKRKPK